MLKKITHNPAGLFCAVLALSIIVDMILSIVLRLSLFDFWTQFFLGFLIIVAGGAMTYWVLRTLEAGGVQIGAAVAPPLLVTRGPYGFSRNPLYLSLTVLYVGVAILFDSPLALLALLPLLYHIKKKVVPAEEAILSRAFGADYDAYRTRVKRWF